MKVRDDGYELTACRCFRIIATLTKDAEILELCEIGERYAKRIKEELDICRAKSTEKTTTKLTGVHFQE